MCDFCNKEVIKKQCVCSFGSINVLLPLHQVVNGHLLLIPQRHVHMLHELDDDEILDIKETIKKIFSIYSKSEGCIGYNTLNNNGTKEIGQHIPHVHIHLFLRFPHEKVSPFKVLSDPSLKGKISEEEWRERYKDTVIRLMATIY